MEMVQILTGDLLSSSEPVIVQQCNCLTVFGKGLSGAISQKWAWANPYAARRANRGNCAIEEDIGTPGTLQVLSGDNRTVICLFAQFCPGKPGRSYYGVAGDNYQDRKTWFAQCLDQIPALGVTRCAFPFGIGCGLAGGKWADYLAMITKFEKESGIECMIYRFST